MTHSPSSRTFLVSSSNDSNDHLNIDIETNEQSINQSINQSSKQQNNRPIDKSINRSINFYGDSLIHCFTYLFALYSVAQVSREWRQAAIQACQRINQSIKQSTNQSTKQPVVHRVLVGPFHYHNIVAHIQSMKATNDQSTKQSNNHSSHSSSSRSINQSINPVAPLTQSVTHLLFDELEYDESLRGCYDRMKRGLPMFMTIDDAIKLFINSTLSTNQSINRPINQSIYQWHTIQILTLHTLDDHRTIQTPRLRCMFDAMPNLNELHITSRSAKRPVINQSIDQPVDQSGIGFDRYVHANEHDYQIQLLYLILSQSSSQLSALTLPAWMMDRVFREMKDLITQSINQSSDHQSSDQSSSQHRFPALDTIRSFTLEHRPDYVNHKLHLSNESTRSFAVLPFVLKFRALQNVSLRGCNSTSLLIYDMTTSKQSINQTFNQASSHVNNQTNIQFMDFRYCHRPSVILGDLVIDSFCAAKVPSIRVDSRCHPIVLVHPDLTELDTIDMGFLFRQDDVDRLPKLKKLGITGRQQVDVKCMDVPLICTRTIFIHQMRWIQKLDRSTSQSINSSIHPSTLERLTIHHFSHYWLSDLLKVRLVGLQSLNLYFDSESILLDHSNKFLFCDTSVSITLPYFMDQSINQPINQSINQSSDQSMDQSSDQSVWPHLTHLTLGSIHLTMFMLSLAPRCPIIRSLTLIKFDQSSSPYAWERSVSQSTSHSINHLNNLMLLSDEHFLMLSVCRHLRDIYLEGIHQLTAKTMIAMSFVPSLQNLKFHRCHGLEYRAIEQSINQPFNQSITGTDTHPVDISALDTLSLTECPSLSNELPLGLAGRIKQSMTIWSQQRSVEQSNNQTINQSYKQAIDQSTGQSISQSINRADDQNQQHQRVLQLGSTKVKFSQSIPSSNQSIHQSCLVIELVECQQANSAKTDTSVSDQSTDQSSDQSSNQSTDQLVGETNAECSPSQIIEMFRFLCLAVDRFNFSLTPRYQTRWTSHHQWKTLSFKHLKDWLIAACHILMLVFLAFTLGLLNVFVFPRNIFILLLLVFVVPILMILYTEKRWPWEYLGYDVDDEIHEILNPDTAWQQQRTWKQKLNALGQRLNVNVVPFITVFNLGQLAG